jgi:hypothetical protein
LRCKFGKLQLLTFARPLTARHDDRLIAGVSTAGKQLDVSKTEISRTFRARLERKVSKSRLVGLLALMGVMVASSYFCTTLPDLIARIAGWVGLCFFSLGFAVLPKQFFKSGPQIVIDARGIEDRRSNLGLVEWADMVSFRVVALNSQKFLPIEVSNRKKYLERFRAQEGSQPKRTALWDFQM